MPKRDSYSEWLDRQDRARDTNPDAADYRVAHDEHLAARDRLEELGPGVHVEQPSERERLEHAGRCKCGAKELGFKHPGHRYRCAAYSSRPDRSART